MEGHKANTIKVIIRILINMIITMVLTRKNNISTIKMSNKMLKPSQEIIIRKMKPFLNFDNNMIKIYSNNINKTLIIIKMIELY